MIEIYKGTCVILSAALLVLGAFYYRDLEAQKVGQDAEVFASVLGKFKNPQINEMLKLRGYNQHILKVVDEKAAKSAPAK